MNKKNDLWNDIRKYVVIGAILIAVYIILNNLNGIAGACNAFLGMITPFIIGVVIAFILNVPMKRLEGHIMKAPKYQKEKYRSIRRLIAFSCTLVLLIGFIVIVMCVVVPQIVLTVSDLFKVVPVSVSNFYAWLQEKLSMYPAVLDQISSWEINWDSIINSVVDFLSTGTKGIIFGGLGAVTGIISSVVSFFIGFVFAIYILFQKEKLGRQCKKVLYAIVSLERADKIMSVLELTNRTFSNFLSGQCLEAFILGTMFVITMLILRLPYAVLVGMVIMITALIPIVGAFVGCLVGVLLIAMQSPVKAVIFVVMFLVLQQIEGNLIYPHVVGNSVGLPGIWVLVAVTIGGNMFGIMGMLTFIPICSVCYALFRTFVNNRIVLREIPKNRL